MTEREDELDRSLSRRKSEGREKKMGRGEKEEEEEGDAAWLYFPNKTPNKCVCVHAWVFVSVSEKDCDMQEGAVIVPFFKQGSLGRDMNNNDRGNAACENQTNITLTFLWLL